MGITSCDEAGLHGSGRVSKAVLLTLYTLTLLEILLKKIASHCTSYIIRPRDLKHFRLKLPDVPLVPTSLTHLPWTAVLQPCLRWGRYTNPRLPAPPPPCYRIYHPLWKRSFLPIHLAHWAGLSLEDVDSFNVSLLAPIHCLAQRTVSRLLHE